jgi:hypothetical protein
LNLVFLGALHGNLAVATELFKVFNPPAAFSALDMQIFRPYIDWHMSAQVLDDRRLGKQRVETKQVMMAILRKMGLIKDEKRGWLNHPIVLMYYNGGRPYFKDLGGYFNACIEEWRRRGMRSQISLSDIEHLILRAGSAEGHPLTHVHEVEYRRVLILKEPEHYLRTFRREEVVEVFETEPVLISGVNSWIFRSSKLYMSTLRKAIKIAKRLGIM